MRISDWSSDVCSSDQHRADLRPPGAGRRALQGREAGGHRESEGLPQRGRQVRAARPRPERRQEPGLDLLREDRKSGVSGKSVSVRVDFGGRRIIKTKQIKQRKQSKYITTDTQE